MSEVTVKPKTPWKRYESLERIKRMDEEGRELLGELIWVFPKRDGSNVSMWLNSDLTVHVSSHNMQNAEEKIVRLMQALPEWPNIMEALWDARVTYGQDLIIYGEYIFAGKGPTRIEPAHKIATWQMFDAWDINNSKWLTHTQVYMLASHFHIPVIEAFETFIARDIDELYARIAVWKKWAKTHHREGVVGKAYLRDGISGFKEKVDLPDLAPIPRRLQEKATYPPMPIERVYRALQHAWDEVMGDMMQKMPPMTSEGQTQEAWEKAVWNDKVRVMPIIAKHISTEAREHFFNPPRNIFELYVNTPIERIIAKPEDKRELPDA